MAKRRNRDRVTARANDKVRSNSSPKGIAKQWSVRQFREESPTGPVQLEFAFPTRDGAISCLRVANAELRHRKSLLDKFVDRVPQFPGDIGDTDEDQFDFINKLVKRSSGAIEFIPRQPGFIDNTSFATFTEILRSDGSRRSIRSPWSSSAKPLADVAGTPAGSTKGVLEPAKRSTFLAFGIGVALASPLPSYLRRHSSSTMTLTETAVFNFSGLSSAGKSSIGLAAQSLVGDPGRVGDMDFSDRGLAEFAAANNDLVAVLDDTEKNSNHVTELVRGIIHLLSRGRSKMISKGADRFPQLHFSTFALASSPRPIPNLAVEAGRSMSRGDLVRLFDMSVPPPHRGGIFDRISGSPARRARKSIKLIQQVEAGYQNHHGHIFPEWILWMLKKDRCAAIIKAVDKFVVHTKAERDGWETRFARKFGLVYAAMKLGVDAGILPWSQAFALNVATKCYSLARKHALTDVEVVQSYARRLAKRLLKPGRMVDHRGVASSGTVKIERRCIGIRYDKHGRPTVGLFEEALQQLVKTRSAKQLFTRMLQDRNVLAAGHGHAGTVQEHLPIIRDGRRIARPHVWAIDLVKLNEFVDKASS